MKLRGFSSLAPRATPALKNLSQESFYPRKSSGGSSLLKPEPTTSFDQNHTTSDIQASSSSSRGDSRSLSSYLGKTNLTSFSYSPNSANKHIKPVDRRYVSQILSRNDWLLLLNHEFKAKRIILSPQFVVSLVQNEDNPLYPLRFYIWVSNIDPLFANNQSVRGALGSVLYRKGPLLLSVELLQDIRKSGLRVTEDLLYILIGSWGRLGLAKYCTEIFAQISFLGISPSTRLYNAVIDALVKSNSLDMAYLKFQQMSADNCKPDRFTYNILIHGVCRTGVVDEALRLVKQMEGLGYSPNVFTYTILIDGFCNAKRVDEAFRLVQTMKRRKVNSNEATIRSLIHGVFRSVGPSKAFDLVISFMQKEPMFRKLACDTLLCLLSDNSMAREAATFLKMVGEKGYLPDNSTFNLTITCLIRRLDLNETCELFDVFIEKGVKPGFDTYLALVEALYNVGKYVEGDQYLNKMTKAGFFSNVFSYNMMIDCFCKASMMNRATSTFAEMIAAGVAPNLVTFNSLISGHCKVGEVHKARKLLMMLFEFGFRPDIFTFSSMIDGLCRACLFDDAFDCVAEMYHWDITPNAVIYNILIRSLCVVGDVARAMKLLKKMRADGINPDTFSFNALIQSFCRMKKMEKVQKLFESMLALGLNPDNYTYCAFIKALCESGRFAEAIEMFHSMEAKGCVPDSYTRNSILETLFQQDRFEEVSNIVKRCNER